MRINCKHCGSQMKISHSRSAGGGSKEVYADCTNSDCYARSVYTITHAWDITPPLEQQTNSLIEQLAQMSVTERGEILKMFTPSIQQQSLSL